MQRFWSYSRILATAAPAPGATILVTIAGDPLTPATLFADNLNPPTPMANPFTAGADGYFDFYAVNGRYDVTLSGGGILAPYTWADILLADLGNGGAAGSSLILLGGSRITMVDITGSPATVDAIDWILAPIPAWDQLPVGATMDLVLACQVPTGASVTLQIFNPDTGQVIQDPTPFTDDTQMVVHTVTINSLTNPLFGIFAKLQAVVTGGDGLPGLLFMGQIQINVP